MMYLTVQWMCGVFNFPLRYATTEITCVKGPLYCAPKHPAIGVPGCKKPITLVIFQVGGPDLLTPNLSMDS